MNNPLDTATICTLFYPLLGQTRIEDNITCAHWDSISSKQKPKTQEKRKKGEREHRVQTWYSCIIPVDEALWSITETTPPCDIIWSPPTNKSCVTTIWDSVATWKYTCHWLAHQGTKTTKPSPPTSQTKTKEVMSWCEKGMHPKGKTDVKERKQKL